MSAVITSLSQRLSSLDAPILFSLSPASNLELHEDLPEELLEKSLSLLEEIQGYAVGVLISYRDFLIYGSGGIAALEAIYEVAQELGLFIVSDLGRIHFCSEISAIHTGFCHAAALFKSDAIVLSCSQSSIQQQLLLGAPDVLFFFDEPTDHHAVYCSRPSLDIRKNRPEDFLLIDEDGEPSAHFRRLDSRGVLHVLRLSESIWAEEHVEGDVQNAVIDFAKKILSLAR